MKTGWFFSTEKQMGIRNYFSAEYRILFVFPKTVAKLHPKSGEESTSSLRRDPLTIPHSAEYRILFAFPKKRLRNCIRNLEKNLHPVYGATPHHTPLPRSLSPAISIPSPVPSFSSSSTTTTSPSGIRGEESGKGRKYLCGGRGGWWVVGGGWSVAGDSNSRFP